MHRNTYTTCLILVLLVYLNHSTADQDEVVNVHIDHHLRTYASITVHKCGPSIILVILWPTQYVLYDLKSLLLLHIITIPYICILLINLQHYCNKLYNLESNILSSTDYNVRHFHFKLTSTRLRRYVSPLD